MKDTSPILRWSRLLTMLLVALLLVPGGADAAEKKSRRKSYVLSETTAKKMMKVGELAEEEDYAGALEILDKLAKKSRLKAHDKAIIYQYRGYMQAGLERYPEALKSFEVSLAQDALPDTTTESLRFNLAQLYMQAGEYQKAVDMFELWLETAQNPGAQAHFYVAAAYAQTERYDKALPHSRRAVEVSKEPVEQYLAVQLAMEFQNGNLMETLDVLKKLVTLFPRKSYYMQLAYGYSNMGDEAKALAMLELAETQGWIEKNEEVVNLAQRYMYHNLPWRAAKAVEKGFEQEIMEETPENYELLANALLHAREYSAALTPLETAARLSDNGNTYVRLAQVYLEVEDWRNARKALERAVGKGDLRDPGNAHLLLGISNFNEKRYKSARSAFQVALKDENASKSAQKWLEHVERELSPDDTEDLEG